MDIIARRLTIITLTLTIFALMFSALVTHPNRRDLHLQSGLSISCDVLTACHASL
jgi:hypothetical protein